MTNERKKIDWSKPIRQKVSAMDAVASVSDDLGHHGYARTGNNRWISMCWDEYGVDNYGGRHVENVPEKFGRWVTIVQYSGGACYGEGYIDEEAAGKAAADYRRRGHKAFAAYVSGFDGDVIGEEKT